MLTKDVIDHYKTAAAIAAILGISRAAVSKWPEVVPEGSAYKLQVLSANAVRVDPSLYASPNNPSNRAA